MKGKIRKLALKTLVILMIGTAIQPALPAQAKVCLSRTKRTYDDYGSHFWDKIKMKNVPSNASIKWKSSAPSVIKIADRFKCGTWYRVLKPGKATVTAMYKQKKYTCRITVKKKTPTPTHSATPKPATTPAPDTNDSTDMRLNETDVTIYHCEKYAIPYIHNPANPTEFQFKVSGTDKKTTWKVTLDDPDVFGALSITKDGLLTIPDIGCPDTTATVTATIGNRTLSAKVTIIDEVQVKVDQILDDFFTKYIKDGMTDCEKAEATARYIEEEYDYEYYQPDWKKMLITGSGDCMASRLFVSVACEKMGFKTYVVGGELHGRTMIRIGDDIFKAVTGFNEKKPRLYWFYKINDEEMASLVKTYPACKYYLGLQ